MKKRTDIFFLLPSLIGFCLFFILPFRKVIYYAFTKNAFSSEFVRFDNFKALLENRFFRLALGNTLRFILIAVPLSMLTALVTAQLLKVFPKIRFLQIIIFLPTLIPSSVITTFWDKYFPNVPPFLSLLVIFLWKYTGLSVMLILTALITIPSELYEAASLDGADSLTSFCSITIPCITPTLFFVLIITIVNTLKISRESTLLYGQYPDESIYMFQNYLSNHFEKLNYQNISAASIIFSAILSILVAVLLLYEHKRSSETW